MQAVVNSLGTAAVAGYTAASKADQLSVLVNNAMMTAISNYVAQNFGAGKKERIRQGVRACSDSDRRLLTCFMCVGILILRHPIVRMFLSDPTQEIYHYSDMYLTIVAPFLFHSWSACRIPHFHSEHAKRPGSFHSLHDRAGDADHCYCWNGRNPWLYGCLYCQSTGLVRCVCTSDSRMLLQDDEKAISICKLDNIFYFVIIVIVRSVHSKLGENPFHIITCQPKPYLL